MVREDNAERSMREAFADTGYGVDHTAELKPLVWCPVCLCRHRQGECAQAERTQEAA